MRTHLQIMQDAGGSAKVRNALRMPDKNLSVFQSWIRRGSIPPGYWNAMSKAGLTTLKELADAAEAAMHAEVDA